MKRSLAFALCFACLSPGLALAASVPVTVSNYMFAPVNITIHPGYSVVWTNKDDVAHTVTGAKAGFDSGALPPGQSFTYRFTKPGKYKYHCALHPQMQATVTVLKAP